MNIICSSYEDLIKRIAFIKLRIESYSKEKELLLTVTKNERSSILREKEEKISYLTYLKEITIIDSHILLHKEELIRLQKEKEKIDVIMSQLEGTKERIFYYRIVKGMTQEQTAGKMYMSVRQVQRLEKKINFDNRKVDL